MKKTTLESHFFGFITAILLIFVSNTLGVAQAPTYTRWKEVREHDSLKLDNLVRNAPVIFEGVRISGEPVGKIINGSRYTSVIIRVGHVYRGSNLKRILHSKKR